MNWILYKRAFGMNLIEISLALIIITLPFNNNINSYAIVTFCVIAAFSNGINRKVDLLRANSFLWVPPVLYFICVGTYFLLDVFNGKTNRSFETNTSLLIFPLFMASIEKLNKGSIKKILFLFVIANIVGSFYCLWQSFLEYKATGHIWFFYYQHLSRHIGINAIYYSMYFLFSFFIMIYYFPARKSSFFIKLLFLVTVLYTIGLLIILGSKMFIFLLYLSTVAIIIYSIFFFKKGRLVPIFMLITLFAIPVLLYRIPYVYSRFQEIKIQEYRGTGDDQNGLAVRGVLWESSFNIIKQKPVVGWGQHEGKKMLVDQYYKASFLEGAKENYNSHNQYLYTWLCYGAIGLVLLLFFLIRYLIVFMRHKNIMGIFLVMIFLLSNITECYMETQKGIVFFLLFGCLLMFHTVSLPPAENR